MRRSATSETQSPCKKPAEMTSAGPLTLKKINCYFIPRRAFSQSPHCGRSRCRGDSPPDAGSTGGQYADAITGLAAAAVDPPKYKISYRTRHNATAGTKNRNPQVPPSYIISPHSRFISPLSHSSRVRNRDCMRLTASEYGRYRSSFSPAVPVHMLQLTAADGAIFFSMRGM